ncbi:MAG: alpha/beta hydrolase [Dehalococcoidia bacterium]
MTTRHLVDPELLAAIEAMPSRDITAENLDQVRALRAEMLAALPPPTVTDIEVNERAIPGPAGAPDVRVLVYQPQNAAGGLAGFLHIHGGGYIIGSPEMTDARNRLIARDLGCVVVSVDYRLAPETAFPGAVEDCYAALRWLHAEAGALGVDVGRIAIGGESAGGGLTAGLALLARDRGEVPVAFQLLIYPMLDDRTGTTVEASPMVAEFGWSRGSNRFGWASLLGHDPGGADTSPYAAAARAEDLADLPPAYIAVGTLDLFLEENIEYARRLMRAGVPTELHVYPGAYHGFQGLAPEARISKAFVRDYVEALTVALSVRGGVEVGVTA